MEYAKVIKVIVTKSTRGNGTSENPYRTVAQYWDLNGKFLFEKDTTIPE